ncbi:MAG: SRPBCC family protein [Chloroflexi bacterium]|nr:SRPBCC family protein [Chloroflexota bacterium]
MPEIIKSIRIEQPIEVVYEYLTALKNLPERIPSVLKAEMLSGEELSTGSQYLVTSKVLGKQAEMIYEITMMESNQVYATKIISGSQPLFERYQFEEDEKGTKLTVTANGEMPGLIKIFSGSFKRLLKKQVENDLERLKDILEEGD